MAEVIGQLLPLAIVIAISPVPIIAVVLMLLSARAVSNGLAFLVGWIAGIATVITVIVLISLAAGLNASDGPSTAASWIKVGLGVLMLLLGALQWRSRPRGDTEPKMPSWMAAVDDFTAAKSAVVAFVLAAANPKNLSLAIAAGVVIGSSGISTTDIVVVVVGFVLLASSSVLVLVVGYVLAKDRVRGPLDSLHTWLVRNNAMVMTILFAVIGTVVLGQGISGLG